MEECAGRTGRGADGGDRGVMMMATGDAGGVMVMRGRRQPRSPRLMMGGRMRRHARRDGMGMRGSAAGREGAPGMGVAIGGFTAVGLAAGRGQLIGERVPLVLVRHDRWLTSVIYVHLVSR